MNKNSKNTKNTKNLYILMNKNSKNVLDINEELIKKFIDYNNKNVASYY